MSDDLENEPVKQLAFVGGSRIDYEELPKALHRPLGFKLFQVQLGGRPKSAKPLKGFGGADVLEILEDIDKSTYRVVYTVRFERIVYVPHVFQKKSTKGIATPHYEIDKVKTRLVEAEQLYAQWLEAHNDEDGDDS